MAWHIVEKFLEQVAEHSTLVGKFWVTFFFVLRFLLVVSIVDTVFGDEQGSFVCNTLTPGCENVCFNDFSPISLMRLWALQILCVALPTVIFMTYTAHKLTKIAHAKKLRKEEQEKKKKQKEEAKKLREESRKKAAKERKRLMFEDGPPNYSDSHEVGLVDVKKEEKKEKKEDDEDEKVCATKLDSDTPSRLMLAYVFQVLFCPLMERCCCVFNIKVEKKLNSKKKREFNVSEALVISRLLIEIGFTVVQFNIYVFKFWIPELFKCSRWPCPNAVDCFVSRPKEKTVMLWIMFATSLIMIVLNVVELYHLGLKKMWEAWKTRDQDITKEYKLKNNMPMFGHYGGGGHYGVRYPRGYPQAVGLRVGYARSSISGEGGNDFDGDKFI